jgi:hypothetical protein
MLMRDSMLKSGTTSDSDRNSNRNNDEATATAQDEIPAGNEQRTFAPDISINVNGETIIIPADPTPSFAIIFDYIDFDLRRSQGKLIMTHNGRQASLAGELRNGDFIKVYWE